MDKLIDTLSIEQILVTSRMWLGDHVLNNQNFIQLCLIVLAFLISWYLTPKIKDWQRELIKKGDLSSHSGRYRHIYKPLIFPVVWLLTLSIPLLIATSVDFPNHVMKITVSLLMAWIIIRLTTGFVRNRIWSRFIAITAWTIAALNILNLLGPVTVVLDSLAIEFGTLRISALTVINGMLSLIVLLWLATIISRLIERQISASTDLTPSVQVLLSKLSKLVLIVIAVAAAVSSVGIDLTAFTVFSGAIGIGIGLGLQKSIANLFSGLVLLVDKSIKPGDVIAIGDTYGWVDSLNARYVSIYTRDGVEHLIPNEQLITEEVQNWTHTNRLIRLRLPIGVHYESDVRRAIDLCIESITEVERVIEKPAPQCLLKGFGDNSVDLELRFWIGDPQEGTSNVKSQILLNVWDKFKENNIEIPYPQRDLHIRSSVVGVTDT